MNPFLLQTTTVGPLELRPWTMTTQHAITAMNVQDMPEARQVMACAWMQSQTPRDLRAALADGTALAQLEEFEDSFPMALSKPIAEWFKHQVECVNDGRVDVIPQSTGRSDTPKN